MILCLPAYGFYAAVVYLVAAFHPSTNQDLLLANVWCIFLSKLFKLSIFLLYEPLQGNWRKMVINNFFLCINTYYLLVTLTLIICHGKVNQSMHHACNLCYLMRKWFGCYLYTNFVALIFYLMLYLIRWKREIE